MVRYFEWIIVGGDTLAERKRRNARQVTLSIAPTTNPAKEGMMANRRIPRLTGRDLDRFWSKVDKSEDEGACWKWSASTDDRGYGMFYADSGSRWRGYRAHRAAYYIETGEDPAELWVCHSCDNPPCVRPSHLFLGTAYDNVHDMIAKSRGAFTDTPEDVVLAIRQFYAAGRGTVRDAAAKHNVSHEVARSIIRGQTWRRHGGSRFSEREVRRNGSLGTRNSMAKLTDDSVRTIRREYGTGKWSMAALGREYGVGASTVCLIVNGESWSHVV